MLVSGNGPILVVAHLDDSRSSAQVSGGQPPSVLSGIAHGPGVVRKAGVIAALGTLVTSQSSSVGVTLVVETDRYAGSVTFSDWLSGPGAHRAIHMALCETVDLPVPAPALFRGATGRLVMHVSLTDDHPLVDSHFSGVMTDIGHALTRTIGMLKSGDGEVLIPGFYDAVATPEPDEMAALQKVAPHVSGWLLRERSATDGDLSTSHLTLGAFLSPTLSVGAIRVDDASPWLPRSGQATIDIRVMPGQRIEMIAEATERHIRGQLPTASVSTRLARHAASGVSPDTHWESTGATMLPLSLGDSPAGLIEQCGVPVAGFSTVWRDPSPVEEQIALAVIPTGTEFIASLIESAHSMSRI